MKDAKDWTIHEWFESQAAKAPDAIAVRSDDRQLTYGELNAHANQLAHHLRALGVGPEVLVGMCVSRSLEMVVGILGILKAGGAYLPLDLAQPRERLAFMLADANVRILLTQEQLLGRLPWGSGADSSAGNRTAICLDADWTDIAGNSSANLLSGVESDNIAYLIYTSGSTGKPKGVLVTHRNVVRLFTSTAHWYDFGPKDIWSLFHSYAFDLSVWEIWGALLYGGRLVVVPYLVSRSPSAFYRLLADENVTVLTQTPSAFHQLIWGEESAESRHSLSLRYVIFGGEALELQSLKPWFDRHGDKQPKLVNMYGITETTVHVTYRPITSLDLMARLGSVIGVPIPDLKLYLLDEDLKPVAPGEEGELFVGGAGLARGYLNRADLTAERFITSPLTGIPGDRLYRTGDWARLPPDGDLVYQGRCDDQVKIRGFRIELGEIQSVLNCHPLVRHSVVTAAVRGAGDRQLVAYLVPRPGGRPSTSDLRDFLCKQLPDYMVPAVFVFLEVLPLTANGKIDKRALPSPNHVRPELRGEYVAPQTSAEKRLVEIWSEVLEVQPVGIDDSFFELGGDSMRAIQLLARVKAQGINITLAQLLKEQTISRILRACEGGAAPAGPRKARIEPFSLVKPEDRLRLPAGLEDAYPLRALQEGMFYHNERFPESAAYHDVFSCQVEFPFDVEKLKRAIDQFVLRHAPMRTSFDLGNYSQPLQLVNQSVAIPFFMLNSRHLQPAEQEQEILDYVNLEKHRPFDLRQAPMMRLGVQWAGDREFRLMVSFHHAILDGWSLAAMVTEILTDYSALIVGTGEPVPPPRVHYREYVALELEALASKDCRRYWANKMRDALPARLPRWPKSYCSGGIEQVQSPEVTVPADVLEGLRKMAQTAGVPLKSVLQAAHYRVMSLLHGQRDVVSCLVTNGRPEEIDGERMVGLLLNVVPLRMDMPGGTWIELVRQMFAAERELIPHRRFPLAETLRITGNQSLFESAVDFVHFHVLRNLGAIGDMGFQQGHYFEANSFTLFATFMMDVNNTQLQLHIDFDPAELCLAQIELILGYYLNTLDAMARDPDYRYEAFSPLSPRERRQILVDWNNTRLDYPKEKCLHEFFETQAGRTPDAVAVLCGKQSLTYAELDQRASRLAHRFAAMGVGPDVPVALCMPRCADMIVAMLGIQMAGGAYVPLDPAYPADRLAFMLEDSQAPVLVTLSGLLPGWPQCSARILCLDAPETVVDHLPPVPLPKPQSCVGLKSLAYIIYTSGSTGKPKGIAIEHRSAVALVHWARQVFAAEELAGVLASTSICFDLSIFEIFVTLSHGGKIILAENLLQLPELPGAQQVTMINTVPSAMTELIRLNAVPPSVRVVNLAGEPLPTTLVQQIYQLPGIEKVFDLYGPSETTTYSTFALRRADSPATIGRPIANTQVYLLDAGGQPVPVGVPGELCIAGDGLARGYLNRPALTAEKFLPNPFCDQTEARLYRTGDLARYLPDGNLEFLGRTDDQVKIRGYRIELGEIESVLARHPQVKQAVVVAREDTRGEKRLVAFTVPAGEQPPSPLDLSSYLKQSLPDYMVPSAFVSLDQLPLTPSGKVDRRALPAPQMDRKEAPLTYEEPHSPVEEIVAKIWSEVLGVERIGLRDNFFDLGGHSLLATRMIARVRHAFEVDLPLRLLFESPTVEGLAMAVVQCMATKESAELDDLLDEMEGDP